MCIHHHITDYEMAMRKALKAFLGDEVKLFVCWSHFTQAVKRNAAGILGLIKKIRSSVSLMLSYNKLMCLPLLPVSKIGGAFDAIRKEMLRHTGKKPLE